MRIILWPVHAQEHTETSLCSCTHAHTHASTHTCYHTYVHTYMRAYTPTHAQAHALTYTHTDKGDKHRQNLSVSSQSSLMCEEEVNTLYLIVTFLYSGHCLHCNILFGRCQVFSHEDAILRESTGPENTC